MNGKCLLLKSEGEKITYLFFVQWFYSIFKFLFTTKQLLTPLILVPEDKTGLRSTAAQNSIQYTVHNSVEYRVQ